jgi:hypothetical protein
MERLFSWEVVGFVVALFIGVAFAFVGLNDFRLAKLCFLIAAADAAGGTVMWGKDTSMPPSARMVIVFLGMGLIGLLSMWSLRYVDGKQTIATRQDAAPVVETPSLHVTDWERLPIPLMAGKPLTIHLHIRNQSNSPVTVIAKYSTIWVNGRTENMDWAPRKIFEESQWQRALARQAQTPDTPLTIPGRMDDYWLPLDHKEPLTAEQLRSLHADKTLYFMGRITSADGKTTLLEFSAHTGLDDRTVLFSVDHNGPP